MKKKIIVLGATIFGSIAFVLTSANVNAVSKDVVRNDEFVFNANELESGYSAGKTVSTVNNVSLSMSSKFDGINCSANGFSFGDYEFDKVLLATPYSYSFLGMNFQSSFDGNTPAYYVSAPKNTKIGIYYTLVGTAKNENTYYVSNDSTLEVVKEVKSKKKTTYETLEIFTEESDTMYYSEFTFDNITKVGIRSTDQYVGLFGLTIVTEEEISYRNEADLAIEALVNEYNLNGVSTSDVFTTLVNNAKTAVENVNHISQIDDYQSFVEITNLYDELVKVEAKIDTLVDTNTRARSIRTVIKYDAESKALLDSVTESINEANELGITNDEISNYDIYLQALADYNQLEEDYNQAQAVVELINNLGEVEYTDSFKAQLDQIESEYALVNDTTNVTNYDLYLEALNAYNALSNEKINEFVNKFSLAAELSGTKESYVAIQEAKNAYDALVAADKTNEEVVNAYLELQNVEAAYAEYEDEVTENDAAFVYNEDGNVSKIVFIATINDFTDISEYSNVTFYITNNETNEQIELSKDVFAKSIKVSGVVVKEKIDNVRYVGIQISNNDYELASSYDMYFTVCLKNGTLITSSVRTIEVK